MIPEANYLEPVHLDFETRSVVDLKKFGLYVYSMHPQTDVWCMAYALGDEPVKAWRMGDPIPVELRNHILLGGKVIAHNAPFEYAIWNNIMVPRYGWPALSISQCECTMARAAAMSLPLGLDMLSKALDLPIKKDMEGSRVMKQMMKPRSYDTVDGILIPVWWNDPAKFERLVSYCMRDVETERLADKQMMPLSETERTLWELDQRINMRGVSIDIEAAQKTQVLVEEAKARLSAQMKASTEGEVAGVTSAKDLLAWCQSFGVDIKNLKKYEIQSWLDDPDLPWPVREVLELRTEAKTSVAKLETALNMALWDGKVHYMFQYHGATTGRWAARGMQLHNLPRPEELWSSPEMQRQIIEGITSGKYDIDFIEWYYGPFMRVMASCLRGYLISAEGHELIGADLKNIEGVALAWLAGEEWKVEAFRKNFFEGGEGIYELTAGKILGIPTADVSKKQRQEYGKVPELALGYQGGVGAFKQMGANFGMQVEDAFADQVKVGWRLQHPATTTYWNNVETAAFNAVKYAGSKFKAGPEGREVTFIFVDAYLLCRLPSGRVLSYPFPELREIDTPWGSKRIAVTFMSTDSKQGSPTKGKYIRQSSYGGKFVENITQAVARDVLAESWPRLEKAGYPIILHVHDETVSEVPEGYGDVEEYEELMSIVPVWAHGMPIAADGFRGRRYRK